MLVVMLILLVATALASISLQTTQGELRAAGSNRIAMQTQYIAENALVSTLAYVDSMAADGSFACGFLSVRNPPAPPPMYVYGEPEIPTTSSFFTRRTQWSSQAVYLPVDTAGKAIAQNIAPLTLPGAIGLVTDALGTLGPQSAYRPGDGAAFRWASTNNMVAAAAAADYVVDLYDCKEMPAAAAVGMQVTGQTSSQVVNHQYYCVLTARGRAFLPNGLTKTWDLTYNGAFPTALYTVNRFGSAHDARGTIVTGPTAACR
jgi:hypothetical protein